MQYRNFKVFESSINKTVEDAYHMLMSNIQLRNRDKIVKTITIASCSSSEGRSTVALNLAVYMARAGKKVLLIDADLRKPANNEHPGTDSDGGLTSILSNIIEFEEFDSSTSIENFYYIPCGIPKTNPSEILISKSFSDLLDKASQIYDFVIIDTPAFRRSFDSVIVAAKSDAVILIAVPEFTEVEMLLRLKEQMEKAKANIIGIALNKVSKYDFKKYFEI